MSRPKPRQRGQQIEILDLLCVFFAAYYLSSTKFLKYNTGILHKLPLISWTFRTKGVQDHQSITVRKTGNIALRAQRRSSFGTHESIERLRSLFAKHYMTIEDVTDY